MGATFRTLGKKGETIVVSPELDQKCLARLKMHEIQFRRSFVRTLVVDFRPPTTFHRYLSKLRRKIAFPIPQSVRRLDHSLFRCKKFSSTMSRDTVI